MYLENAVWPCFSEPETLERFGIFLGSGTLINTVGGTLVGAPQGGQRLSQQLVRQYTDPTTGDGVVCNGRRKIVPSRLPVGRGKLPTARERNTGLALI